jgi:hypothetical protein
MALTVKMALVSGELTKELTEKLRGHDPESFLSMTDDGYLFILPPTEENLKLIQNYEKYHPHTSFIPMPSDKLRIDYNARPHA